MTRGCCRTETKISQEERNRPAHYSGFGSKILIKVEKLFKTELGREIYSDEAIVGRIDAAGRAEDRTGLRAEVLKARFVWTI